MGRARADGFSHAGLRSQDWVSSEECDITIMSGQTLAHTVWSPRQSEHHAVAASFPVVALLETRCQATCADRSPGKYNPALAV